MSMRPNIEKRNIANQDEVVDKALDDYVGVRVRMAHKRSSQYLSLNKEEATQVDQIIEDIQGWRI